MLFGHLTQSIRQRRMPDAAFLRAIAYRLLMRMVNSVGLPVVVSGQLTR